MSIHVKKINALNSFCGLSNISSDEEFKDYNVFFANNGSGKTSITRALELLIAKNTHISKYQTINSNISPSIGFELSDRTLTISSNNTLPILPFKLEVYNSDFLHLNAPLNSEFGLKKLDDETIVLEGSAIGEETKEIEELNKEKIKSEERQNIIGNYKDIENISDSTEIKKEIETIIENENDIEKVRKNITSNSIQIKLEDFIIENGQFSDISLFNYDEKKMVELEKDFDELNTAIKKFDSLEKISIPTSICFEKKFDFNWLFIFDIEKEAGKVSLKVKEHISKIGREFIEDGMKIINVKTCPFCTQTIKNGILEEYISFFNESVKKFNSLSADLGNSVNLELKNLEEFKKNIFISFDKFQPFIKDFKNNKLELENTISELIKVLKKLKS